MAFLEPVVVSAILAPLCQRVINATFEEYQLVSNVKEEVKKLRSTVSLINGVLQDAEDKQVKDEAVNIWLRSLKQILLDAEDVLEEHAINYAAIQARELDGTRLAIDRSAKVRNAICCFDSIYKLSKSRRTTHQIKDIRKKLDDMSKERESLGLRVSLGGNSWAENRRPRQPDTDSMLAVESYIIGRDDEKERIIQLLLAPGAGAEQMSNMNKVHVLAIVGMGGVGKTTLARLVFNDPTIKQHFELMMWVCVSENFDLRKITREIMESAVESNERKELFEISNWDLARKRFKGVITEKRFLLVLDDMWEEDPSKWESLYESISCGGKGGKIIITTRNKKVSDVAKAFYVPLKSLSSEDLWPILQRYAFDGCDSNKQILLETVGKQIVERLKGSPLAAKTIGRLLNSNLDVKFWRNIIKSERWMMQQQQNDILHILKLSYDHLPGHLKQAFAYCSLFPKDHKFNAGDLVQLWMAQNFIHTTSGLHAESVGSEYFNDLLYKSFFEKDGDGNYLMHDLIHDLAESVSKEDCFRLVDDRSGEISETIRHVSLVTNNFDAAKLKALCKQRNLRTLLLLSRCTFDMSPHLDELFLKLKWLRVLGLGRCRIKELPTSIGSLKHLRFVDLEMNPITKLPESFCYLHNLQVLKLKRCRWLGPLPSNMNALINLRHLEAYTKLVSNIQGLGRLTALQELSVSGTKVRELAGMDMLRRLEISDLDQVQSKEEAQQARLCAKEDLDVLKLRWKGNRDDHSVNQTLEEGVLEVLQPVDSISTLHIVGYGGVKSPSWMEDQSWVSFSSLERVELEDCQNWEVLPPLGRLRCLKFLTIQGMRNVRQIGPQFFGYSPNGVGQGGGLKLQGFPSLEVLTFGHMPVWEKWEVPIGDDVNFLPRLRILQVNNCPQLIELPPLPPSLTRLVLFGVGLTRLPGWFRCRGEGNFDEAASSSCSFALSCLSVWSCQNLRSLNDGLLAHPLQALKELQIESCDELESLPERGFSHLTSLESLSMKQCHKVSWPSSVTEDDVLPTSLQKVGISACGDNTMGFFLPMTMLQKLTSLGELSISGDTSDLAVGFREFTSLTSLQIVDGSQLNDTTLSTCLQGLTSLRSLKIEGCPLITTLSICLTSLRSLSILRCPLITTLSICLTPLTSLTIFRCPLITTLSICLTTLERLGITYCKELTSLGGLDALVCLKHLSISHCPKLLPWVEAATSPSSSPPLLPPPTGTLLSLNSLKIWRGDPRQVTLWLRQCASLRELVIEDCRQLTCFDGEDSGDHVGRELEEALLNLAPSLRSLSFDSCENLRSLPSKLRCLSSLEELEIGGCPQIQRLPATGLPESLESLFIGSSCPALKERCEEVGRPDWPLISHIPRVFMG